MEISRKSAKPDADKLFVLADRKWSQGKLKTAFRLLLLAAKAGDRGAQTNLGYFYDVGIGTRRNKVAALSWYKKAFRGGDTAAAHNIATIWRDEHEPKRALAWFRRAAKSGDDGSNLDIARHYLEDESNPRKAVKYLTKVGRSGRVSEAEVKEASQLLKIAKKKLRSAAI
jgi:TPR repeat protein